MSSAKLVTAIAVVMVVCSALVITTYLLRIGPGKLPAQAVRFVLTCLLSLSLVRGSNAGRWIAVILLGLGTASSLMAGFGVNGLQASAGMVVLGLIYAACGIGLMTPTAGEHFAGRY